MCRRVRRSPLRVGAAVLATLLLTPTVASAHAILVQSSPAPGAQLRAPPSSVSATFSEPLNRSLSRLTLIGPSGKVIVAPTRSPSSTRLLLKPEASLARGVYQVRWHSVSADDGHALDGAYYFGVQVIAPAGTRSSEASPLGGDGWLRALLRAAFDAALILFCGGVFGSALLARKRAPAAWLLPDPGTADAEPPLVELAARLWRRIVWAGVAAVLSGLAATLADAANAGQGLSSRALHAYLLSGLTGEARIVVLGALALAVALAARRAPVGASACAVLALAALTVSGHANSAHPRGLALASDLAHLVAAAVWLGGVAQIAWTWIPRLRELDAGERRQVIERVLPRFGRVALPAFLAVGAAGFLNAVIELGSVPALWNSGYGRVLLVKVTLVGAIALASYTHALRIRPRLLGSATHLDDQSERRHWRLLGTEPMLAVGVVLAAGILVAFPPPNRTLSAGARQLLPVPTAARGPDAVPAAGQLSVAEQAGSDIVAARISHIRGGLSVQIQTLTALERPIDAAVSIPHIKLTGACGVGCHTARLTGSPSELAVEVRNAGRTYSAQLPIRYQPGPGLLARRLLSRVEGELAKLRAVRIHESLRGGPTVPSVTAYELRTPDRFAYQLTRSGSPIADTIIIGTRQWGRTAGQSFWQASVYGGGGPPFDARAYLGWWTDYAAAPRLLDLIRTPAGSFADVATVREVQGLGAVWLRLRLDITHSRLLRLRMITAGHFMTQIWGPFNTPQPIEPPPASLVRPGQG